MILLGTQNEGKLLELRAILGEGYPLIGLSDLPASPPSVLEDGSTYRENAFKKAHAYFHHARMPVLADDSGLEVDVLNGAPGVDSAHYGGRDLSWPQRWACLQNALRPFPAETWTARFRCVLCFFDGAQTVYFEGVASGKILEAPQGEKGFGYDPIVFSDELGMSFAQASVAEKNRVSHRARALAEFKDWLMKTKETP
jgi:XTP/dITP diphosphohydrolase